MYHCDLCPLSFLLFETDIRHHSQAEERLFHRSKSDVLKLHQLYDPAVLESTFGVVTHTNDTG